MKPNFKSIDITKDVPVIYSIGNFWFNSKNLDAGIVKLTVNKQGLKSFQFLQEFFNFLKT